MTDTEREMIMAIIRDEAAMADAVSKLEWRKKAVGGLPGEADILLRTCEAVKDILGVIIKMQEPTTKSEKPVNKRLLKYWTLEKVMKNCMDQPTDCETCPFYGEEFRCGFTTSPLEWRWNKDKEEGNDA